MTRRSSILATAIALQAVALVLAHELTYLARYGSRYGEALVHSGHGVGWSSAVATSLALGAGLAVAGGLRLAYLRVLLRRQAEARTQTTTVPGGGSLPRTWLRIAPRMVVLSIVLLTTQENLERAAIGLGGADVLVLLSPEYAGGLWITAAVALAVSLVAALFSWRQSVLLARLHATRARVPRPVTRAPRPAVRVERPRRSILGRRSALRAPPAVLPA